MALVANAFYEKKHASDVYKKDKGPRITDTHDREMNAVDSELVVTLENNFKKFPINLAARSFRRSA